jgi:parallel beta-helix repeat protein
VVDGVDVHNNRVGGVRVGHKTVVRNSKFHHNGWAGLMGAGDSIVIENNEISYNNVAGTPGTVTVDPNHAGGGFKFVYTRWLVVRNNFSHHNSGAGMWTDINNIYTTYDGNRVEDNTHVGIFHEISYDATIRTNLVRNNGFGPSGWKPGAGIQISNSSNVKVYGNRVIRNANGVMVYREERGTGAYGPWDVSGVVVRNNTIKMAKGQSGFLLKQGRARTYFNSERVRFTRNTYYLGYRRLYFEWRDWMRTRREWRSYGQDRRSTFRRLG